MFEKQREENEVRESHKERRSGERSDWPAEKEIEVHWGLPEDEPRSGDLDSEG